VQMGLIYVNPEGPNGNPDPIAAARDISRDFRPHGHETTKRRLRSSPAVNTFGKTHGAGPATHVGPEPEAAGIEEQGLGWKSSFGTGKGGDAIAAAWKSPGPPRRRSGATTSSGSCSGTNGKLTKSPAGAHPVATEGGAGAGTIPDAHDPSKRHAPTMLTTDLSLRLDPAYEKISRHFYENPDQLADAFARAWFKLTHRDMGPRTRYLGPEVPAEELDLARPRPRSRPHADRCAGYSLPQRQNTGFGLSVSQLVSIAWASASTFRGSDKRGGANGARIRLAPQKDWDVNHPAELAKVLRTLEGIQGEFNSAALAARRSRLPT